MRHPIRTTVYLLALLIFIIAAGSMYAWIFSPRQVTVSVLNVGKGDATLIQSESGASVLIDTGGDGSILRALGDTLPFWQRTIDVIVLKNASQNAAGGVVDVVSRYRVSSVVRFGAEGSKTLESTLSDALGAKGLAQTKAVYGARLTIDGNTYTDILPLDTFTVFYGTNSLSVSSTTPKGVYVLSEETVRKIK